MHVKIDGLSSRGGTSMNYRKWIGRLATGIATLTLGAQAFGWGAQGHQLVGEAAAQLTGSKTFWAANEANIGKLVTVPDWYWKSLPTANTEKPTHFYQPDSFIKDISQFGKLIHDYNSAVKKYGAATV